MLRLGYKSHILLNDFKNFIKKNIVLDVAFILALITMIFVPINKEYLTYFDMRTLTCLFCTLLVVNGFKNICIFEILARKLVEHFSTLRSVVLIIIFITFFASMLLANDMALLTFLPLGYYVLKTTNKEKYMAFVFIMQNIAANLGGMITPFGNPQNLYLYSYFEINNQEFIRIMLKPFLIATILIIVCCMTLKNEKVVLEKSKDYVLNKQRVMILSILFILSIAIVFRILPYYYGLIIVIAAMILVDYKAFFGVDYALLLTFCCFFVFSSNLSRIPFVESFISTLISKNTLLISTLSCQLISNVPSAILLSHFTTDYAALLIGVNIGGCGTLIASLASLITFSNYKQFNEKGIGSYFIKFSLFNFGFLIILLITNL